MYYSITKSPAIAAQKHLISAEYMQAREAGVVSDRDNDAMRLMGDMDRVSKYPGKTRLGLLYGYYEVFLTRSTHINCCNQGVLDPYHEESVYSIKPNQWAKLGTRFPGHASNDWWTKLETLRLAKTDRAYHSVLFGMEAIGKLGTYKLFYKRWKPRPIDPLLVAVWKDELGDEEEDRRCGICFDDLEFTGSDSAVRLDCGHVFGKECIKKWVESSNPTKPCPICRTKVGTPPARPVTPDPTFGFGLQDPPVTVNCAILSEWYRDFKAKEQKSGDEYANQRLNAIHCPEVGVMEQVFSNGLPASEGHVCGNPKEFSLTCQRAVASKLSELLGPAQQQPLREYIHPGFERLVERVCDGMALRLRDEAIRLRDETKPVLHLSYYEDEGL